jgi:cellulose synthase/poly-beta-1,6-N-acetylglucosamine synthase-like glycosyltransferase
MKHTTRKRTQTWSVIIPLIELSSTLIHETLPALQKQNIDSFEVLVLPNNKSQKDAALLKKYPWLRITPTGPLSPPKKRDMGAKLARGTYLAFIDDDAFPAPDWLKMAKPYFDDPSIYAVCGPGITPITAGSWEQVFNEILTSRLGSGQLQYRYCHMKSRFVTDYPSMNFIIRRNIFLQVGGFNTTYWPGEDSKLCNAITYTHPHAILYTPEVVVYHHRRPSYRAFLAQQGSYGYHRGMFFAQGDRNSRRIIYTVPSLFLIYTLLLALMSIFIHPVKMGVLWLPLFAYIAIVGYILVRSIVRGRSVLFNARLVAVLVSLHMVYGYMFIKGYFFAASSPKNHV